MFSPLRKSFTVIVLCLCVWLTGPSLIAQPASPPERTSAIQKPSTLPDKAPPDYSHEALVIEHSKKTYRYEKDGTGRHELALRVRVQSEAALTEFGQLVLPYVSANETLEIDYVRVKKTNGTTVAASPSDVQDLTAPISREAPIYTDLRQKHVTVPGLRPGDTLEYHIVWKLHTPVAANHFWLNYDFIKSGVIVLDEQLEVNVPQESAIKLKTEKGFDPVVSEKEGRRVYTWKHSVLKNEVEDDKEAPRILRAETEDPKPPTVQVTTFKNWEEVGQWYEALARDRITPDEKIRAKVAELIQDRKSDQEKIEALYEFVAKNFRYVSLSLGQGRYQPHAAAEVMANQYGDCKDKHTLLTAMLIAAGFNAYPALINSSRNIDPDLPSPGQFDHVISAIPLGNETIWVDTTPEVAPFRLLSASLRDKKALVIPSNAAARLETTPPSPPFVSSEVAEIEAHVSELGKLIGKARFVLRGDAEMYYRLMLRRTPKNQWRDLGYLLSIAVGVRGGELTEIKTSDIEALNTPLEVSFNFTADDFLDWSAKKLTVNLPIPDVNLPEVGADKEEGVKPIHIGVPIDISYRLKLTMPAKYQVRLPVPLKVTRDYATYAAVYKLDGNVVRAERSFNSKLHELPAARTADYRAFVAAANADAAQTLSLETTDIADASGIPDSVKAEELMEAAEAAARNNNYPLVESLIKRVLDKEPKHKTARRHLGYALFTQGKLTEAAQVLRDQTTQNPFDEVAYTALGRALWALQDYAGAETAFRKQLEITPLDKWVHGNLGLLLIERRKYKEAIPELEQGISLNPEWEANYQVALGRAYLGIGEADKGTAAFDRAVKLAPGQTTWNNVAYYLAENKVQLDRAQQYAESAVTEVSTKLRNVELASLTQRDLQNVAALAAYWDTLGWVYFQKKDLDSAERYITAAWRLGEGGAVGYHLGQIFEKRGFRDEAIRLYARAAYASRTVPEALESLEKLVGKEKSLAEMNKGAIESMSSRTVDVGRAPAHVKGATEARFFVALVPGPNRNPQVADVKFISGDEKLRPLATQLKTAFFAFVFPDDKITKVIRRGTLSCLSAGGNCTFIMMSTDYVPLN